MEIYHYSLAKILRMPCLREQILLVAPSVCGINPYTKTYGIDTKVAQERHAVLLGTVAVVELFA